MSGPRCAVILVVDADPVSLTATAAVLQGSDYEVHGAESPEAARQCARDNELDLIICDLDVAGVDGYSIVQEILGIPGRGDVPVMYSSACQRPPVIRKSHMRGAVYHLRKPFDPQVLIELTERALGMPHLVYTHLSLPHFGLTANVFFPHAPV